MITSLLVAVDSSDVCPAQRRSTPWPSGKAYEARVTGLYVLDIRYLEMPPYLDYSYTFEAVPPTLASDRHHGELQGQERADPRRFLDGRR